MNRIEKEASVQLLAEDIKKSEIAICADYQGLTVAEITSLRGQLRAVSSTAKVVKNTLAKLSLKQTLIPSMQKDELEKFSNLFLGPSLLIYGFNDPIGPARIVAKFIKDTKKLEVKGALFEGRYFDESSVASLATMASREEVMAQLLRVILAPAIDLVRLMQAPSTQVARVIQAHCDKLSAL